MELLCSANIVNTNKLKVEYNVAAIEKYLDLISSASVFVSKKLDSQGRVRVWGSAGIDSSAQLFKHARIDSHVFIPYGHYLDSLIEVTTSNRLEVVFSLAQAPIITQVNYSTQDTYIRQDRPTLNFGSAQSLIIGNTLEGEYMTLIQFDISDYLSLNDVLIRSGDLIFTAYTWANSEIDVYEIYTDWTESNVTWNSFQAFDIGNDPIFSFSGTTAELRINILDYLNQKKLNNDNKINLLLKIRNEPGTYSFFSKDSPFIEYCPRIEIKYQDMSWSGFSGEADLGSSVQVIGKDTKELASWSIFRQLQHSALNGSALVGRWESKDLSSQSSSLHKRVLDSFARITFCKDLESFISIAGHGNKEIDSYINIVESSDILSNSNIIPVSNLHSTVLVVNYGQKDLDSFASLQYHKYLDSIATIIKYKDLSSVSQVMYSKSIDSLVNTIATLNLYSNVTISDISSVSLNSTVQILTSRETFNLDSIAQIFNTSDVDSSSSISKNKDLESLVNILQKKDLESLVNILKNKDLESLVNILKNKDLESLVNILQKKDLESFVNILKNKDLDSLVNILQKKDLESLVNILQKKDLESLVNILQKKDLESLTDVLSIKNILSSALIRQCGSAELITEALFRRFDINEIDSESFIIMSFVKQLPAEAIIRVIERDESLIGTANIVTSARQWIPGIHGKDVFKVRGKLPRVWKRENFIL